MKVLFLLAAFPLVLATAGGAPTDNRFQNPSFEHGRDPWVSLVHPKTSHWHDFAVGRDPKDPGRNCARLDLSGQTFQGITEIWGVVQEVQETAQIPRYLSGRYYVENWQRGKGKQYIQVAFNVWVTENHFGELGNKSAQPIPMQVAFVLAGISAPPFEIRNRKYVFAGLEDPKLGEWIDFSFDLRAEFEKQWGFLPKAFKGFRVLFEARLDGRRQDDLGARALVCFDDLYLGEKGAMPVTSTAGATSVGRD